MNDSCIICREDIDSEQSIKLDCDCVNSLYHTGCLSNWIKSCPEKTQCLNCFYEMTEKQKELLNNHQSNIIKYVEFLYLKIDIFMFSIFLIINIVYNLILIINFRETNDPTANLIYNIEIVQFVVSKINLKLFLQFFTYDSTNSKTYIKIKNQYIDFYYQNQKIIDNYIGFTFGLNISGTLYCYLLKSTENKLNIRILVMLLSVVFLSIKI